jgi:hypothetical protein
VNQESWLPWLLEGPPWIQRHARQAFLGLAETDPTVAAAHAQTVADPQVRALVNELRNWPGAVLNSHKSAGHPLHKLVFLADLGLRAEDPGLQGILQQVLAHQAPEGPFQVLMNIPRAFGGNGQDQWAWALCDAPLLVYALVRFGLAADPRLQAAIEVLTGLVRDNGWPCAVSPELGKFRGPGRREDPCPYTNLIMLKLLAQLPAWRDSPAARTGAEALLVFWQRSREWHPYMFYCGTDFRKLKAPLVWYDLLHALDVLSQCPWLLSDPRFQQMKTVLAEKANPQGRFQAESVWQAWQAWEFGQKREPSRWITHLAQRILARSAAA